MNKTTPVLSVVIVTFNGSKYIDKLMHCFLESSFNEYEIIVTDNHSKDDTLEQIRKYNQLFDGRLKVVALSRNYGYAMANNIGFKHSSGRVILLLNQDTWFLEDTLKTLVQVLLSREDIGISQCKLRQYYAPQMIDSCGDVMSSVGLGILTRFGQLDNDECKGFEEIPLARGAALGVKRDVIEKVGGLFPSYCIGVGYEDIDLSLRARLAGYKVVLIHDSLVFHDGLKSWNDYSQNFFVSLYCLTSNLFSVKVIVKHLVLRFIQIFSGLIHRNKPSVFGTYYLFLFFKDFRTAIIRRNWIKYTLSSGSEKNIKAVHNYVVSASLRDYLSFRTYRHRIIRAWENIKKVKNCA